MKYLFIPTAIVLALSAFGGTASAANLSSKQSIAAANAPPDCSLMASPFQTSPGVKCSATSIAPPHRTLALSAMAAVGKLMFSDTALSMSGKQSCATCHSPTNAFTAGNNAPVQPGGGALTLQGLRNTPTLMYASYTPGFALEAPDPATIGATSPANQLHPAGGFMRDGRLASLASQAQQPFITSFEMGNIGSSQVAARLKSRPYLSQFTAVFGPSVLNNPDATLAAMGKAIAAFEFEDPGFHPFTSKYDAYVKGQVTLTAQESEGLQVFSDPNRGHCMSCHATASPAGVPALFTNYSYHTLGVPRNWEIAYNLDSTSLPPFVPANGLSLGTPDHNYYDMGLCGPLRTDLANNTSLCGSFKVPTLRNVGIKQAYFHNGVFSSLQDVVSWYATRNSNPTHWYKKPDGSPDILYNDLPLSYAKNVEPVNQPGGPLAPDLDATDIRNLVSFLCTLTDGFDPKSPSGYNTYGQCKGQ
jgi:cytochrome c peroxidase